MYTIYMMFTYVHVLPMIVFYISKGLVTLNNGKDPYVKKLQWCCKTVIDNFVE